MSGKVGKRNMTLVHVILIQYNFAFFRERKRLVFTVLSACKER